MLGAAVMRECLADPQVARVMTVGRSASALHSAKLEEIVHADLSDYSAIETSLTDFDACFFCLGVFRGSKRGGVWPRDLRLHVGGGKHAARAARSISKPDAFHDADWNGHVESCKTWLCKTRFGSARYPHRLEGVRQAKAVAKCRGYVRLLRA
jgi:hypothetical protein